MDDNDNDSDNKDEGCIEHTEKWIKLNKINNSTTFSLDNIPSVNKGGSKIKRLKKNKKSKRRIRKTRSIKRKSKNKRKIKRN